MKTFEITLRTVTYAFKDVIITTVLYLALLFWFGYDLHPDDNSVFMWAVLISIAFYLAAIPIPALVLFLNYWSKGSTRELIVNNDSFLINGEQINFSDIKQVVIVGTYQHFNPPVGVATLPYNDYFYYIKLFTISGQEIVLTSLLGYRLDSEMKNLLAIEKFEQDIKAFPTV